MKTNYTEITKQLENIDISLYAKNRNFIDGSVTKLSPYISRGILSTKEVFYSLSKKILAQKKLKNLFKN